ncbi:MAG: hypothetical protein JSS07_11470 [Proteobacteria bacterium]|nr:hypothetical protein [Pseudomonadota bacterium]
MKKSIQAILSLYLLISTSLSMAIDFQKYTKNIQVQDASETSRKTLLGIIENCGNSNHLDDDCMIQNLERVAQEENISEARNILKEYEKALAEGNFSKPECQTEGHLQANRTLGHCILLLNSNMLENYEESDAVLRYEMCLQGGMMGLAYHGNLAAQYMLSKIYHEKSQEEQARIWSSTLKTKKETDEYHILMSCYGSFLLSLG